MLCLKKISHLSCEEVLCEGLQDCVCVCEEYRRYKYFHISCCNGSQTPQTPIVRTKTYEKYNIDEFPLGTNAIVAVLAYSG